MEEMFAAQTGNPFIDILNGNVPLGNMQRGISWSLLNLMMSIIAIFNTIILLVTLFARKRKPDTVENDEQMYSYNSRNDDEEKPDDLKQRLIKLKVPALLTGVIPGILFLLLENIRLPITWITQWTPLIGAFFIIHMVLLLVQYAVKRRVKEDERDMSRMTPQVNPGS